MIGISTWLFFYVNKLITNSYGVTIKANILHMSVGAGNGILISVLELFYNMLVEIVVNAENHLYQTAWEDSYIKKEHFFEFAFNYFTLFYYAFIIKDYELLLFNYISLMISRNMLLIGYLQLMPMYLFKFQKKMFLRKWQPLRKKLKQQFLKENSLLGKSFEELNQTEQDVVLSFEKKIIQQEQVELSAIMPPPPSLLYAWNYVVLQFGYIGFFSYVFPLGALFGAIIGLLHINLLYYTFSNFVKRPIAVERYSIGIWKEFLETYSLLSLFVGSGILMFTSQSVYLLLEKQASDYHVSLTLFFTMSAIMVLKFSLDKLLDDVPDWVQNEKQNEKKRKAIANENSKIKYIKLKNEIKKTNIIPSGDEESFHQSLDHFVNSSPLKQNETINPEE